MASRDTDPTKTTQQAKVIGRITDEWGNPVQNKPVSFTISDISSASYNADPGPSFDSGTVITHTKTATTDTNGNAIITFYPGSFVKEGNVNYIDSATGSCLDQRHI